MYSVLVMMGLSGLAYVELLKRYCRVCFAPEGHMAVAVAVAVVVVRKTSLMLVTTFNEDGC